MKIGRRLSLVAVVSAGVLAGGTAFAVAHLDGGSVGPLTWVIAAVAGALGCALTTLPMGLLMDRDAARLADEFETVGSGGDVETISDQGQLASLRKRLRSVMDSQRRQLEKLEGRSRELEIRRLVGDSEREHAEAILQSLQDAVIVTDGFNELKMANARAGELLGFVPDDSLHRPIGDVLGDEVLQRLIAEERDLALPGHRKRADYQIPKDGTSDGGEGSMSCFDVTLTALPDPKKGIGGVVTILRDVTREREISQTKSDFVSKVSHELRTPLSSINAYVELLVDGEAKDEDSRQEFYLIIKNEADRLNRLIDNMLNISRIEAGIVKTEKLEVDFNSAAQKAAEVILPQARLKDIGLTVKTSPLACTAMADPDMVQQILLNLMSNAVKYTPEGGRVTLAVENDDTTGSVMITVADTGLGIPPDALPKIFDKFYRIENYKRVAKGTGLGLALVKHIVETVHHGTIEVTSELGMGSRFIFTIPYEDESA